MFFDSKTLSIGSSLLSLAASVWTIMSFVVHVRPRWLRASIIILIITFNIILLYFAFASTASQKNGCGKITGEPLYKQGYPLDTRRYVTVSDTTSLSGEDLQDVRRKLIAVLLKRADVMLVNAGEVPYGEKISSYFCGTDIISKQVSNVIHDNYYVYLDETLDTEECLYGLRVSLARHGRDIVDSLIRAARDSTCILAAIDHDIVTQLNQHGQVSTSFDSLFGTMCNTCPDDIRVKAWRALSARGKPAMDSLYFDRAKYALSATSQLILNSLRQRLEAQNRPLEIEFHGFCDTTRVRTNITYDGQAYTARAGTLLPVAISQAEPLKVIRNNLDLSFARGYSCYTYLKEGLTRKDFNIHYTGHGENPIPGPLFKQRSVIIIIKVKNNGDKRQ